jgi:DNA-directed RNA polymerase subunit RPC12/RpoP
MKIDKGDIMAINYYQCPECEARETGRIIRGGPSSGAHQRSRMPDYRCSSCGNEWTKEESVDYSYRRIKVLEATVGGYSSGDTKVTINFERSFAKWEHGILNPMEIHYARFGPSDMERIRNELKSVNLLDWKRSYHDSIILDGTQWEIVIHKSGSNMYPREWKAFCRLMKKITSREFG